MTKCYFCGGLNRHLYGCKDYVIDSKKLAWDVNDLNFGDKNNSIRDDVYTKKSKVYNSFISIENLGVAAGAIVGISNQPHVTCRIQHFWIDELIASQFMINSIRIMNGERLIVGSTGRVFANLFRSGRWPLTEKADSIFGIDLSGWPAMTPAHRVEVIVENISYSLCPFRACFEVLCIS